MVVTTNGYRIWGWDERDDENILKLTVVMAEQLCKYTKTTEMYSLNGLVLWYVTGISIKL